MKAILFSLLMLISAHAFAEKVKVGYVEFPPMFFTNDKNEPEGVLIDLTTEIIENAGHKAKFISFPAKRMAHYLATGVIDLWVGIATSPAFKGTVYISKSVITQITLRSYSIGRKNIILNKEDLRGKNVIILNGYNYGGWTEYILNPKNRVDYLMVNSHLAGLKALEIGRMDYLLDYQNPINRTLRIHPVLNLHSNQISTLDVHLVISRKTKDAQNLLKKFENSFKAIQRKKNQSF